MKKLLIVVVVLAMVCLSSMAFAVDVTVSGEVNIRSRNFNNFDLNSNVGDHAVFMQERVLLEVNVKADNNVKGKVAIRNDWDTWGRFETPQGNGTTAPAWAPAGKYNKSAATDGRVAVREAWLDFMIPDMPVGIKAGHQLLQLGNGWFLRSNNHGSDAWLVYMPMVNNTFSFLDIKMNEGGSVNASGAATNLGTKTSADDVDVYTVLGSFKLNDVMTVGFDFSLLDDRAGFVLPAGTRGAKLYNLGLNFVGKVGPVNLKAEIDIQDGKAWDVPTVGGQDVKYTGNQIIVQGSMPLDKLTLNATMARGSGNKSGATTKNDGIVTLLDTSQKYTLIYEYSGKLVTASGATQTGFQNTTAISAGMMYQVVKRLALGGDVWYFMATEATNVNAAGGVATGSNSHDVGYEIDVKANWTISPNVSWNWTVGYFKPGAIYKDSAGVGTDAATAVQGYLALKF